MHLDGESPPHYVAITLSKYYNYVCLSPSVRTPSHIIVVAINLLLLFHLWLTFLLEGGALLDYSFCSSSVYEKVILSYYKC